jgi:hypothetical protein
MKIFSGARGSSIERLAGYEECQLDMSLKTRLNEFVESNQKLRGEGTR